MSEEEPTFSDPADETGNSQLWLPAIAALLLFLIVAAAFMLFSSLTFDAVEAPSDVQAPAQPPPPAEALP